jgi:type II restriction enzyme
MCLPLGQIMINTYSNHIKTFEDLKTTYEETRAGFIEIALEKNRQAVPFVEEARVLQNRIRNIQDPLDLLNIENIRLGLISAAGISEKAAVHLGNEGCTSAIHEFIKQFLQPAGNNFKEEVVFRFLLTKGETLGGKMRNIVGVLAQKKLCRSIVSSLNLSGTDYKLMQNNSKDWIFKDAIESVDAIENIKSINWVNNNKEQRTLYFNATIPIVKNNIDVVLLNTTYNEKLQDGISKCENYLALGELKGGIDPAGADEHWKTAKSAIDRIKVSFGRYECYPSLFFIGAAIENKMAREIFNNLKSSYIANAANLTKKDQMISLVDWLIAL